MKFSTLFAAALLFFVLFHMFQLRILNLKEN